MSTGKIIALLAQLALCCMLCSVAQSRELRAIGDPQAAATAPELTALSASSVTPPVVEAAAAAAAAAAAVLPAATEELLPTAVDGTAPRTQADVAAAVAAAAAARAANPAAAAAEATAGALATVVLSSGLQANLNLHNSYRARHLNTPALSWDTTVANSAANWAAGCTWGVSDTNNPYGENRYATSVTNVTQALIDAINDWYSTIQYYNFNSPGYQSAAGTFTQVVWSSSLLLGCAGQSCPSGLSGFSAAKSLVVCRYSPAGNFIGKFDANVNRLNTTGGGGTPPPPSPSPAPPVTIAATVVSQGSSKASSSTSPSGSNSCWTSPNGIYKLCIRTNGRAELVKSGTTTLWTSGSTFSTTSAPYTLTMEYDGRLTIYNKNYYSKWTSSNSPYSGYSPYKLRIQNDGNVVIVDYYNNKLWQTGTGP